MPLARRLAGAGATALSAALDHLLRQHDWARARLAGFAGRVVRVGIDVAPLPGLPPPQRLARILDDGRLEWLAWPGEDESAAAVGASESAVSDAGPAVRMLLRPSVDAAFALMREGAGALTSHLHIEGEAALAAALGDIARQLHWDAEEDLSRVLGDVLARRMGDGVASARAAAHELRARIGSSAVAHLTGDARQLVARTEVVALGATLDALGVRIARLEACRDAGGVGPGFARPADR